MNSGTPKAAVGSAASALLTQGSLYAKLAWIELDAEKDRLLQTLLVLLVGFSLLTSVLVAVTTALLLASWDTSWRDAVLFATALFYGTGLLLLGLRFSALAGQGRDAFANTRAELAVDLELLRSRLEQ